MISAHRPDLVRRLIDQMMARERGQAFEEIRRLIDCAETLGSFGAVALADARDDRFLGGEIAVEVARAHAGFGADVLHRGLMEAGAGKAALGGVENLGAAVGLALDVWRTHESPDIAAR